MARATQGSENMGQWFYRFENVNKYVNEAPEDITDPTPVGEKIFNELNNKRPFDDFEGRRILRDIKDAGTLDEFNDALNDLYNFADDERIWLGSGY